MRSQAKSNVTQSKAFHRRAWRPAIARYHANALTTAEVLEELIRSRSEHSSGPRAGEESGLTEEESAFYDALAQNESARDVMGEPASERSRTNSCR